MIRLMEMVKYRHIRPYTKIEMRRITDDYLRNNKYKEVMPDFLKDKDDVLTKLQKIDQLEFLSDDELSKLNNSKVANMKATTKDPGDSMKTDSFNWDLNTSIFDLDSPLDINFETTNIISSYNNVIIPNYNVTVQYSNNIII